jgi:hypothetical protein
MVAITLMGGQTTTPARSHRRRRHSGQTGAEPLVEVGAAAAGDVGVDHHQVEAVGRSRMDVQLDGHAGPQEAVGVVDVLPTNPSRAPTAMNVGGSPATSSARAGAA